MTNKLTKIFKLYSEEKIHGGFKKYSTNRQKYREKLHRERLWTAKGGLFDDKDYTGDVTPTLRPMALVINSHLKKGHTFPDRDLVALHITEEANFRGISFQTDKSDELKLYCHGPESFLVYATNSDYGWMVTRCNVLEESVEHLVGSPISIPRNVPPSISRFDGVRWGQDVLTICGMSAVSCFGILISRWLA